MSHFDIISDQSQKNLQQVPEEILNMCNLKMLYLEGNEIQELPQEFFPKLPKLTWLDLRNNQLKCIPANIARHEYLENFLLTNNQIDKLPNELGLVARLKVLQVAENPIVYPHRKIIAAGTNAILSFLRSEYENSKLGKMNVKEIEAYTSEDDEKIISVVDGSINDYVNEDKSKIKEMLRKSAHANHPQKAERPYITVKGLSKPSSGVKNIFSKHKGKIVHKITRGNSRLSLKSYCNVKQINSSFEKIQDVSLKEEWLGKLKTVLDEQEKILQQEKNLNALCDWRYKKKTEPLRDVQDEEKSAPPFAVDPEYGQMLSREDLSKQIDKMMQRSPNPPKKENIDKLINDLVSQLKEMEGTCKEMKSPRSEIEEAGKQIKMIMNIHKKMMRLQANNDSNL